MLVVITHTDIDRAVQIANSAIYGLGGAVWAATDEGALKVARRLRTGRWISTAAHSTPTRLLAATVNSVLVVKMVCTVLKSF